MEGHVLQFVIVSSMIVANIFALCLQFSQASLSPSLTTFQSDLPRRGSLGLSLAPVSAELQTKFNLKVGEGLAALNPVAGLTADKAGIKPGDILLSVNGKPVAQKTIGGMMREIPTGSTVSFKVMRDGKTVELATKMVEKPRDPGNANYEVIYSHVVSHGQRMRTIITKPRNPGKYPGFFFIQGFSPVSYDYTLETSKGDVASLDGPILFDFANSGFVTIRVEKPGVGDSEGGPFAPMDYTTELDIYRQSLKQLKALPGVDVDNIFIFGHSMGGSFGPMIAAENPVKGIAVYGTAGRTWFEYLMDTIRYQGIVGGGSYENADEISRQGAQMMAQVFLENKTPDEVKKSHPHLKALIDDFFPDGLFNGKSLDFWRQLAQTNFAAYWAKLNSHVLAVKGEADFVVYEADHKLIENIVNRAHPGFGKFEICPQSDHLFHKFSSEQESMKNFQRGTFNPAFSKMMMTWIRGVIDGKS
jgi:hypothetical protein